MSLELAKEVLEVLTIPYELKKIGRIVHLDYSKDCDGNLNVQNLYGLFFMDWVIIEQLYYDYHLNASKIYSRIKQSELKTTKLEIFEAWGDDKE